jgi:hypothetical protein
VDLPSRLPVPACASIKYEKRREDLRTSHLYRFVHFIYNLYCRNYSVLFANMEKQGKVKINQSLSSLD